MKIMLKLFLPDLSIYRQHHRAGKNKDPGEEKFMQKL